MRAIFDSNQMAVLEKIGLDENDLMNTDSVDLGERVGDYLVCHCLGDNYDPNEDGLICESILDKLSEYEYDD